MKTTYTTATGHTFTIRTIHYPGAGFTAVAQADDHNMTIKINRPWANERLAVEMMTRKIERTIG